jgi:4-hydroxy-tetrahydrodipicolinate synthase
MGEAHKLTESERLLVIKIVMEQNAGRIPVVVGCTANSTDVAIYLSRKAEEAGATAVMIAPPQNLKNEQISFREYPLINICMQSYTSFKY